jgi:signal transduction histidine kinase
MAATGPLDRGAGFAAYVAHELRTPIALQLALAEAALADPRANKRALRAMCGDIIAGCQQQQRLIAALLVLTRSDRGLTDREPVDVAAITSKALRAREQSKLECVMALAPAVAIGDSTLVERLVANLISNAIRHNILDGRLEVATRTDAGCALLTVANTGPLIPRGELPRLFEPFERLGSQPQPRADGVGLGLTIVQSIADAHNATVAAHAQATGGLAIEIRFPQTEARMKPAPITETAQERDGL